MISFTINGTSQRVDVDGNTPLLWVIRDLLDTKGTKFGCGKAACGACTLHVDGEAVRSCSYAVKFAEGKNITIGSHGVELIRQAELLHRNRVRPLVQTNDLGRVLFEAGLESAKILLDRFEFFLGRPVDAVIDKIEQRIMRRRLGAPERIRAAVTEGAE